MKKDILLALRNLTRHGRRNVMTALCIIMGYTGLALVSGYNERWENTLTASTVYLNHGGSVSIYKKEALLKYASKPREFGLSKSDQDVILAEVQGDPKVDYFGRYLVGYGLVGNGCTSVPFLAKGIDTSIQDKIWSEPTVQKWTSELMDFEKGKPFWTSLSENPVGLSLGLARRLKKSFVEADFQDQKPLFATTLDCIGMDRGEDVGDKNASLQILAQTHGGYVAALEATAVNHFSTGVAFSDESSLLTSLSTLQKLYETEDITYLAVYLKNQSEAQSYAKALKLKLQKAGLDDVEVYPYTSETVSPFYVGIMSFLYSMEIFFAVLFLAVVILSVVNTLSLGLLERKKELGLFRSIGFSPNRVAFMIMCEGFVLAVLSVALGVLLTQLLAGLINSLNIRFRPVGFSGTSKLMSTPGTWTLTWIGLVFLFSVVITSYVSAKKFLGRNLRSLLE